MCETGTDQQMVQLHVSLMMMMMMMMMVVVVVVVVVVVMVLRTDGKSLWTD